MSPTKKKPKLIHKAILSKRECEFGDRNLKRRKGETESLIDIPSLKRKNFVKACETVSYKAYRNSRERLQLLYLPACTNSACIHYDYNESIKIKEVPSVVEESFAIEMKSNMWCDALEVCRLSITPTQYLSSNILKNVIEIILNAHEDNPGEYPIRRIIDQCQQILTLNFSRHPPCFTKSIRKCYNTFLTSAMDMKENTFTNRSDFECKKGIVKYCMNRLEYEISIESKDAALVNKDENIPDEMKQSVKGIHWQKEKLEIFEVLERRERIERLMAVLYSVIELLQFDLAIWYSRYTNNLGCHIMRSHKPLMASILWSNNVLYTGAVNANCRQILKIFIYLIHLNYPNEHINTMQLWLNTLIQTFYVCENNSNSDYPNIGKYCTAFAKEFYKILMDMPYESTIRILEKVQPTFMQHLIGTLHIKSLLPTPDENIIAIAIDVINNSKWTMFPENRVEIESEVVETGTCDIKKIKYGKFFKCLSNICKETLNDETLIDRSVYTKFTPCKSNNNGQADGSHLVHVLYITLKAYLDAFSVQEVQETLDFLNSQLFESDFVVDKYKEISTEYNSYTVTENFIKKYRRIYQLLKELVLILGKYREVGPLHQVLKVFDNISLLSS